MNSEIKVIEDLSLNAWPSHQMQMYDGWILRFSYFYTHRTNCVEQVGASVIPLEEKLNYAEHIYQRWQTPCIYKISPITDPAIEEALIKRGYHIEHETDVMTVDLKAFQSVPHKQITLENTVSYRWLQGLFSLKNTQNIIHQRIVPSMYDAIPKDVIAASIMADNHVIATGLGILDRDYIGIYAIHVKEEYRRHHYARFLVSALLSEGKRHGAKKAYLQVVSGNEPAKALYKSLGFTKMYDYHFRVKEI